MTLVAGIDVGNSTTEIVVARTRGEAVHVVGSGAVRTEGVKGSAQSLRRAGLLLEQLERRHRVSAEVVAMARFQPVVTSLVHLPVGGASCESLEALMTRAQTPAGEGLAAGRLTPLAQLPDTSQTPLVVAVPGTVDFADAADSLNRALDAGLPIVGVLCEADEGVLVGNRLRRSMPILDEVPLAKLVAGELVLLEVAAPGCHVEALADPLRLAHLAGLPPEEVGEAAAVAARVAESRAALVHRRPGERRPEDGAADGWLEYEEGNGIERLPLDGNRSNLLAAIRPGAVRALRLPASGRTRRAPAPDCSVRDLFAPDLEALMRQPLVRRGSVDLRSVPLSMLKKAPRLSSAQRLGRLLGRPVVVETDEALAAFRGAMTTPGAPPGAVVCDLGAGTINVVDGSCSVTVAGAGDLLTLSAASLLDIPVSLAERVKRYTSVKPLTPHLIHDEDGGRRFADEPVAGALVGKLCASAPSGLLPFEVTLGPEEWRALRLSLKVRVVAANLDRALAALERAPAALVLCGGGALDRELTRAVADGVAVPGLTVGRADVGPGLGPRYAVALGLVLTHQPSASD